MFEVEKTEYGLRLTLEGYVDEEEISRYCESVRVAAEKQVGSFGVVADMREATAMPDDSAAELKELMAFCDRGGWNGPLASSRARRRPSRRSDSRRT